MRLKGELADSVPADEEADRWSFCQSRDSEERIQTNGEAIVPIRSVQWGVKWVITVEVLFKDCRARPRKGTPRMAVRPSMLNV